MELINKNIKTIITIIVIVVFFLLIKDWIKPKLITMLGGYVNKTEKSDTVYVFKKGKIDTLAVFTEYINTKGIILNPKPKIIYKYLPSKIENGDTGISYLDSVKMFDVVIKDSVIDGTIQIINKFNGDLVEANLNYFPLVPKLLVRVDTIFKTINKTITLDNNRNKFGIGVGYNNHQFLLLSGSYTTKKDWQFITTYGKSINDTKQVINGIPFSFTPNDFYGITIMKHF